MIYSQGVDNGLESKEKLNLSEVVEILMLGFISKAGTQRKEATIVAERDLAGQPFCL